MHTTVHHPVADTLREDLQADIRRAEVSHPAEAPSHREAVQDLVEVKKKCKKNMIRDRKFREIGLTRVPEVVVQKIKSRAMLKRNNQ